MRIREAEEKDAEMLCKLLAQLGYPTSVEEVSKRISHYQQNNYKLIVGEIDDNVIAFIALHWYHAFHHSQPIGRIVAFCVDEKFRAQGLGSMLLNNAEDFFQKMDCEKIELTSNLRRAESHEYYLRKGYVQTSKHFIKVLKS